MCIDKLLEEAKKAEIEDNAEDAFFFHMQISAHYKRIGNVAMSNAHKSKANVYKDDEEVTKMRFI